MQRPTSMTVIGWLAVGFGILAVLSGVLGLTISLLVPELNQGPPPSDMPAPFRLMSRLFNFFWVLAAIQVFGAALMIAAGAGLLRLKAWARTTIEVFAWLGLAYNLGFGVFWVWSLSAFMQGIPKEAAAAAVPGVMMVFGVVMIIAFSIPLVIVIRVLRGPTVRAAIASANEPLKPVTTS